MGIPSTLDPKARSLLPRTGPFWRKFLSKELSGRKVELDEVIVTPSESSAAREDVPVVPTPTGEEVNDDDHEASDQVTAELRRSTRTHSAPEWYVSLWTYEVQ